MAEQTTDDFKKCPQCKKPMQKKKRYYRNGKYYCNKNCWKGTQGGEKAAQPEAT